VSAWQIWMVGAVLLLVAEMFAPGFWLLCVAIGCLGGGIAGLFPLGLTGQVLTFAASTLLSLVGVRPILVRHYLLTGSGGELRTNVEALVGQTGLVSERIDSRTGRGRVKVNGEDWRGASVGEGVLEPGTRVIVVQVDGTRLMVEKELDS